MKKWNPYAVVALVAAAGVTVLIWAAIASTRDDPARNAPRELRIGLGQTVGDFMTVNGLQEGPGGLGEYTVPVDKKFDADSFYFTDVWVAVYYEDGKFSLHLPPGRVLVVGQAAGVITDFQATLHAQPYPFEQADRMARDFIDARLQSGWHADSLFYPRHVEDSNSTRNRKVYAHMTDESGNALILMLTDLSRTPRFDANIPGSAPLTPADPTPRFLVQVQVWAPKALRDRRSDYVSARRFAASGAGKDRLSLRTWLDDPDWTPERLGMKQVDAQNPYWNPEKPWLNKRIVKRWQMPDGSTEP